MASNNQDEVEKFNHKEFLAVAPTTPGVYDMRDATGETLYIGKARNLKNRLSSYFRSTGLTSKTMALINKIADIAIIITNTETEALILEQNLIKERKPKYNTLLKDDKSYPYIVMTTSDSYPRLGFHRAKKKTERFLFWPLPQCISC